MRPDITEQVDIVELTQPIPIVHHNRTLIRKVYEA